MIRYQHSTSICALTSAPSTLNPALCGDDGRARRWGTGRACDEEEHSMNVLRECGWWNQLLTLRRVALAVPNPGRMLACDGSDP